MHSYRNVLLFGEPCHLFIELRGDAAGSSGAKPDLDSAIGFTVPFLVHFQSAEQRGLAVFDESRMHGPGAIASIFASIHDDLSQTASDATLFDSAAETFKAIAVGKLQDK